MSPLYKKLLLWFCAANIAVLLVSVFVTDRIGRVMSGDEPEWDRIAAQVLASYEQLGLMGLLREADRLRHDERIDATLYRNGENLLQRRPLPPMRPFLGQLLAAERLTLRADKDRWLAGIALTSTSGERLQFVALRGGPKPHERRNLLLGTQIALSVLVIAALGFVLARSLTAPITAIQTATRSMATGDLAARTDAATAARRDELGALARDFNHMAARTETLVNQQRTVLQDVSHELRSPLARLQLLLELARQGASEAGQHQLNRAEREVSRLDALIGEVLNLSRLESVLPGMATAPLAIADLFATVVDEHALDADAKRIALQVHSAAEARTTGDAALLARALGNVLGNALKFSPADSTVSLSARVQGRELCVEVADRGPGVPAAQLSQLFQPFYRGDNAALAEGHGLGLAIAQRIAQAHGGRLQAHNRDGGGLVVSLWLPLAAA